MNFPPPLPRKVCANTLAAALAPFASHGARKRARRAPKQRASVAPSPILRALVSRLYAPIPGNPRAAVAEFFRELAAETGIDLPANYPPAYVGAAPWHGIADPRPAMRAEMMADAMREAAREWPIRNPSGV